MTDKKISQPLAVLLKVIKQENPPEFTWEFLKVTLSPFYHSEMSFSDVMIVFCGFYEYMVSEQKFGLPKRNLSEMLLQPLNIFNGIKARQAYGERLVFAVTELTDKTTVDEFYACIISKMLCDMRLSNIGWCREEIFGVENEK